MLRHLWRYTEYLEGWKAVPKLRRPKVKMTRYKGYWIGSEKTRMVNAAGEFDATLIYQSHVPKWAMLLGKDAWDASKS